MAAARRRLNPPLRAPALLLEPLRAAHAEAMFPLLADAALYRHIEGGPPPTLQALQASYARQERRGPPEGHEVWLNWIIRRPRGAPMGFVQATLDAPGQAWIAYVLGHAHQGQGHARAATAAMLAHLEAAHGCTRFLACVERANARSIRLLRALGFRAATAAEARPHGLAASERLYIGLAASTAALASQLNLGPRSAQMLQAAGIDSLATLRRLGSVAAYVRVRQADPQASLNLLWALEGALSGLPWQQVARDHRTSLLLALEEAQRQQPTPVGSDPLACEP